MAEKTEVERYDHLSEQDPIRLPLDLDALADTVIAANYGLHRMLSALVRVWKRQERSTGSRLLQEIERLLEEGEF